MSNSPDISLYLIKGTIRIHRSTINVLGYPKFIRLMVSNDGRSVLLLPAQEKDFQSFRVPKNLGDANWKFEIGCIKFCRFLIGNLSWEPLASYRISADLYVPSHYVRFCLFNGLLLPSNNRSASKVEN